jgi:hypothetical protein
MRKIALIVMVLGLLIPSICFGAGSSATVINDTGGTLPHGSRIITALFVADDTTGVFPDLTLNAGGTTSGMYTGIIGWKLFKVKVFGKHDVTHDGSANATKLTDASGGFNFVPASTLISRTLTNTTDSSAGTITAVTNSTITATLAGGGENDWDVGDVGLWGVEPTTNSEIYVFMDGDDILKGNGVNAVDADANNEITPYVGSLPSSITITNDLVINITQEAAATNSAIVIVQLELYK